MTTAGISRIGPSQSPRSDGIEPGEDYMRVLEVGPRPIHSMGVVAEPTSKLEKILRVRDHGRDRCRIRGNPNRDRLLDRGSSSLGSAGGKSADSFLSTCPAIVNISFSFQPIGARFPGSGRRPHEWLAIYSNRVSFSLDGRFRGISYCFVSSSPILLRDSSCDHDRFPCDQAGQIPLALSTPGFRGTAPFGAPTPLTVIHSNGTAG